MEITECTKVGSDTYYNVELEYEDSVYSFSVKNTVGGMDEGVNVQLENSEGVDFDELSDEVQDKITDFVENNYYKEV